MYITKPQLEVVLSYMLLEACFDEESIVFEVNPTFDSVVREVLPFTTTLIVWKEEIYFETPVSLDISRIESYLKVDPGALYYWPPEKGFCIFYGISQPYTPVYPIGVYIGILRTLGERIKDGTKAVVKEHRFAEDYRQILSVVESAGFRASTPLYNGERVIEAVDLKIKPRVSFRIYVEDYGLHVEGEPLFLYSYDLECIKTLVKLKERVALPNNIRFDLTEEGWVTLTGYVEKTKELGGILEGFRKVYGELYETLNDLLAR